VVVRANGDFELLDATATVLGAFKDRGFEERSVAMSPGDRLVLFSDGFSEANMDEKSENWAIETITSRARFEEAGLAGVLASAAASDGPQADDITVMDLRVL
jgi:serine phosphatase RsbU (regulator of sigma subunit)